jgi:surface antigen
LQRILFFYTYIWCSERQSYSLPGKKDRPIQHKGKTRMRNFIQKLVLGTMMVSTLALGACQTMDGSNTKQVVGTGGGAIIGGILGSKVGGGSGQLWATGAGALLGALVGSEIGKSLDAADRGYASKATHQAYDAPVGETISWRNPDSGNYGNITPTRDGYSSSGRYCREYQQTIYVGGKKESGYGTACRQPDGSWEIVD